ncbi:rhodanese-like domain-containing protein [uncultured Paludibaculum sp.]|uniref:rhodanese-like domain-containing protein n=1 Tax=uncultured Paludibaculum sp. TaxID=1765020 RepID=UPI002AAA65F8|nr:rhodanese-like domain-containing protein [uncultured Paludibaculum sp.]
MTSTTAPRFSSVLETPAADPEIARAHFASKLSVETDPSDVFADMEKGIPGFVVVDVRSPQRYAEGHVPGSLNIPHRTLREETTAGIPRDTVVITYCDGPGCNGSTKGALRFASLGYRVKEMIGGLEWWVNDGYAVERDGH